MKLSLCNPGKLSLVGTGTCTRSCALLLRGVVLKKRLAKPLSPPSGEAPLALAAAAGVVVDADAVY